MSEQEKNKESEKEPLTEVVVGNPINNNEDTITDIQVTDLEWTLENKPTWNGNICDCFTNMYPTMLGSFCCPNIYAGYLYGLLTNNKMNMHKSIWVMFLLKLSGYFTLDYDKTLGNILIYSSNIFLLCLINFLRSSLRKSKNIPGSDCEDAFVTVCCTPCSLAQVGRTLTNTDKMCDSL